MYGVLRVFRQGLYRFSEVYTGQNQSNAVISCQNQSRKLKNNFESNKSIPWLCETNKFYLLWQQLVKESFGGFFRKSRATVVGVNWRGMDIIRSVPKRSRKRQTDNQMLQQYKFKLVVSFLQPLRSIQELYFGSPQGSLSQVNLATSETLNTALELVERCAGNWYLERILITKERAYRFHRI